MRSSHLLLALAAVLAPGCNFCSSGPAASIDTAAPTAAPEPTRSSSSPATLAPRSSKAASVAPGTSRPDFDALARPHATLTNVHTEGALDLARARAAVVLHLPDADACFARRLAEKPGLRGTLEVRVAFPGASVTVIHTGADSMLTTCMTDAFATWPDDLGEKGVLLFRLSLYSGLELPSTMPDLPPPPALPKATKGAAP